MKIAEYQFDLKLNATPVLFPILEEGIIAVHVIVLAGMP